MNMDDVIPNLKIERMEDGIGDGLILLAQDDNSGNIAHVAIHPIHLRYMAERFGLVETSDPHARKAIAALTRRLRLLRDRIDHLGDYLTKYSDHAHANLDYELTYVTATAALADAFCAEFDDPVVSVDSATPAWPTPPDVVSGGVCEQSSLIRRAGHKCSRPRMAPGTILVAIRYKAEAWDPVLQLSPRGSQRRTREGRRCNSAGRQQNERTVAGGYALVRRERFGARLRQGLYGSTINSLASLLSGTRTLR